MKTLAELKRDAQSGKYKAEMTYHFGKPIPERMKGFRPIVRSNSVAIFFKNADGKESELRIDSAKLIEYDGETVAFYSPLEREPNAEEQAVLDGVKAIYEKYKDEYNGGYWQVKDYVAKSKCPYMDGSEKKQGKKYQTWNGRVLDYSQKGGILIQYKVTEI